MEYAIKGLQLDDRRVQLAGFFPGLLRCSDLGVQMNLILPVILKTSYEPNNYLQYMFQCGEMIARRCLLLETNEEVILASEILLRLQQSEGNVINKDTTALVLLQLEKNSNDQSIMASCKKVLEQILLRAPDICSCIK